jgi:hypothetical protein
MPCLHEPCKARPMKGAEYCFFHNPAPDALAKRNAARSAGGKAKRGQHDPVETSIAEASATLTQLRQQLAAKKKITASDTRAVTALLNSIVYAKESAILRKARDVHQGKNTQTQAR